MRRNRFACLAAAIFMVALLFLPCAPVSADAEGIVYINSTDDFAAFAENCSYDAWSRGKTVILQRNISLGGVDFFPIASFGGIFEGGGHTISGLTISASVSPAGLFGTVAETGVVRGLTVEGSVAPGGDGDLVGGVAGVNRGVLENCAFTGTVEGEKRVGGIAGENAATGVIRRGSVSGGVFGKNMTGGVAGVNHGTVTGCSNRAYVNTNTLDPSISFDKLDLSLTRGLSSLMSPDVYNVTVDSGGVAGFSDGTILGSRNYGSVGYQHIGYNVGGVAGRSSGHIATSANSGRVYGRREVGGVVGVAEPYVKLHLNESSAEEVRQELAALSNAIDRAVRDAQGAADAVSARLTAIGGGVDDARAQARALTGRLSDYYDDTAAELNRGSGLLSDTIDRLYDVSVDMEKAAGKFSDAADELERAADDWRNSPAWNGGTSSSRLSAMTKDFQTASDILEDGAAEIRSGLDRAGRVLVPGDGALVDWDGSETEEERQQKIAEAKAGKTQAQIDAEKAEKWERKVYGYDEGGVHHAGALDTINEGLGELADALQTIRGANPAGLDPTVFSNAEEALRKIESGVAVIRRSSELDASAIPDGLGQIADGLELWANGGSKYAHGAFYYLGDGMKILSDAIRAAGDASDGLMDALDSLGRAMDDLSDAASGASSLLDYLRRQKKLDFQPLDVESDADALYDSLHGVSNHLELLNQEVKASSDTVLEDVRQINRRFTSLMNILLDVVEDAEGLSVSSVVEDTSDEDLDAVSDGKVLLCTNAGEVSGDIDTGGIAGAMMIFNELDPEHDSDSFTSAFRRRYELKCIVQDCANSGTVGGRRDNVGAVCGNAALGVISGCEGYGTAESEGGDYVGGIAGYADNIVRKCWAKCTLSGARYIGGIVGGGSPNNSGLRVENCRALVEIADSEQYAGAIAGCDTGVFSDNRFVSGTLAGLDRVSYAGRAEPVSYEELLAEEGLPQKLRRFTLTFLADGAVIRMLQFHYGDSLDSSVFPEIPPVAGKFARWDREDLNDLRFDTVVNAVYATHLTALDSAFERSGARPVFLVEGTFDDKMAFDAEPAVFDFDTRQEGAWRILRSWRRAIQEQWQLTLPDDGADTHTVRYLPPEDISGRLEFYERGADGTWTRLETGEMGSYLTFKVSGGAVGLTVVSAATPWWVWLIVAVFLFGAAALLAELLTRRRPKRAPQTDEEKAKAAMRRKKRKKLRVILVAAVLALGVTVGTVLCFAPDITDSMALYVMLRNYAERADLDMELSLSAEVGGKELETAASLYRTECEGKRAVCVLWEGIPVWLCNGTMVLENGRAYRADGVVADYSELLSHAAGLYRAVAVTSDEENGVKTYHAAATDENARRVLATLLPGMADALPEPEAVGLDLVVTDGELTRMLVNWDGGEDRVSAALSIRNGAGAHTLPQAVRGAIVSGDTENAGEIEESLTRILTAWIAAASRSTLTADVALKANCGPLLVDEQMTWQRTRAYSEELSCVSRRGSTLYYTDTAACMGSGLAAAGTGVSYTGTAELLRLAYEAFLLGDANCVAIPDGWRCSITLDADQMAAFAALIAPDTRTMALSLESGTIRLELRDGRISTLYIRCSGSVRVVRADIPASLSAHLEFDDAAPFAAPSDAVLSKLGLARPHD